MDYPPLATSEQLAGYPGGPFSVDTIDATAEAIRMEAGWHIAPVVTETLTLDSDGEAALTLPTLKLVDVLAVRYWNGAATVPLGGWDARTGWSERRCSIYRSGGFPAGRRRLEVDVVHGYEQTPKALLAGMARIMAGPSMSEVAAETLPGHSVTFRTDTVNANMVAGLLTSGSLAKLKLGPRP